ncbi:general secretion pathway protein GspM [Chromatium okenii]|uniref:General secretion pathway protein GspM n=2 Tax=Chromatium okenii TaxID=61644 RepID=A0A2S7XS46_9GAMM|nr:general secretion pathway protein GspM [Chromatium okenii]
MRKMQMSIRYRCAAIWTLVLLLVLALGAGLVLPWITQIAELDQRIATSSEQLMRYQRLVQTLPAIKAELAQAQNHEAVEAFYFKAPTAALIGAQLQTQVQEIVAAAEGRLISTQLLPEDKNQTPPQVRVRTQIQGTMNTLREVLERLAQAQPLLFVEQLSVRSSARAEPVRPVGRAPRQGMMPPTNPAGELTLQLDILGFVLAGKRS